MKSCFIAWQDAFGVDGHREGRAIMAQVRAFFESHGVSRFDNANSPNNDKILNRAGFYQTDSFDQRTVTRVLLQAGWLKPASDGNASHKPRIKGVGTPRLYVFTGKIWEVNKN